MQQLIYWYGDDNVSQKSCASFPLKKTHISSRNELPFSIHVEQKTLSSKGRLTSHALAGLQLAHIDIPRDFAWHLLRLAHTILI